MTQAAERTADRATELSRLLWQQRRVLERLRYCLRVQDLMLDGEDAEALVMAVDDVHIVMEQVAEFEAARREQTIELGLHLGLGSEPSLQQLIDNTPPPFDEMLADHRDAFLRVVADITTLSLNGREHIQRGLRLTQDLVASVLGDRGDIGYDPHGGTVAAGHERHLIDRQL
ncbi:MAG: flagellar export chaperone FlgN [Acidimicrobiales bacterium]